jgi:hypothetical protein
MASFLRFIGSPALLVSALLALTPSWLGAAGWSAPLVGGGEVRVDPRTNRATVVRQGVETQLWDGVHRLQDGSTIIIHSGQAIPNTSILRSRSLPDEPEQLGAEQWIGVPISGYSPCERLVRRVCGVDQACSGSTSCDLADQLLDMEQAERKANDSPNYMTYASGQCQEANQDKAFFASCGQEPRPGHAALSPGQADQRSGQRPPSACRLLVDKVCGSQGDCSSEMACDAARQLLQMAQEVAAEQGGSQGPAGNPTEYQCVEALSDEGFFKRCPAAAQPFSPNR